jgi:hypothetical protein
MDDRVENLDLFLEDLVAERRFREWSLPTEAVGRRISRDGATFGSVVETIYLEYANSRGKEQWGDKTPEYIDEMPMLSRLFTDARFVHIIRDGRDVSLSLLDLRKRHGNAASAAYVWARTVRRGRNVGARGARSRSLHSDPLRGHPQESRGTPSRAMRLSGVRLRSGDAQRDGGALKRVPGSKQRYHSRLSLPPTKGLRDWRTDMSEVQTLECEAVAGDELARCGYERVHGSLSLTGRAAAWAHVARFMGAELNRRVRHSRRRRRRRHGHGGGEQHFFE